MTPSPDSPSAVEVPGMPGMCPDIWHRDGTVVIGGEDDGTGCPGADGTITATTTAPATPAASSGPDGAVIGLGIAAAILAVALIAVLVVLARRDRGGGDQ